METETSVYHTFSDEEKRKIHQTAQELERLLAIWAPMYPVARTKRLAPVAVLVATVLPDLPVTWSLLVCKIIMFIFAVDDLADEHLLSYIDFLQAAKTWEEIARYGRAAQPFEKDSNLSGMLSEIRTELSGCALFPDLSALWVSRLNQLTRAMANEYEYGVRHQDGGNESLPTLEKYIEGGTHSVGFPFWGTSMLIILSEPAILEQLYPINDTLLQTGAAIRLYNDVRTYEKEVQENNINALTIIQSSLEARQPELSAQERLDKARDTVIKLANQYAEKSCGLAGRLRTGTGQFEQMIRRIVAFHAQFYGSQTQQRDYHTISSSDAYSMINE